MGSYYSPRCFVSLGTKTRSLKSILLWKLEELFAIIIFKYKYSLSRTLEISFTFNVIRTYSLRESFLLDSDIVLRMSRKYSLIFWLSSS